MMQSTKNLKPWVKVPRDGFGFLLWVEREAGSRAGAVLQALLEMMDDNNAVIISQSHLADRLGVSRRTVIRALADLDRLNAVEIIRLSAGGEANAYRVSSRLGYIGNGPDKRAEFTARVYVRGKEQPDGYDHRPPLVPIENVEEVKADLRQGKMFGED